MNITFGIVNFRTWPKHLSLLTPVAATVGHCLQSISDHMVDRGTFGGYSEEIISLSELMEIATKSAGQALE